MATTPDVFHVVPSLGVDVFDWIRWCFVCLSGVFFLGVEGVPGWFLVYTFPGGSGEKEGMCF